MTVNKSLWPISRDLLMMILEDRTTDCFVATLIWERLGYEKKDISENLWIAGKDTPFEWSERFPHAPQIIVDRKASVYLNRSIPNEYKQLLKDYLKFKGYQLDQLFPRLVRRAIAVNWLLAWVFSRGKDLPETGDMPDLLRPPKNPVNGHAGDPKVQ